MYNTEQYMCATIGEENMVPYMKTLGRRYSSEAQHGLSQQETLGLICRSPSPKTSLLIFFLSTYKKNTLSKNLSEGYRCSIYGALVQSSAPNKVACLCMPMMLAQVKGERRPEQPF